MPRYLVRPTSYPIDIKSSSRSIKIIDFGQSFLHDQCPGTLRTPLPVRAPEVIFKDKVDYRVDLWSIGCLVSPTSAMQALESRWIADKVSGFSSSLSDSHRLTAS